jgi:hypothetical protein
MKTIHRWLHNFFFVWVILLVADWFLLWSRFYPFGFRGTTQKVFEIINFPLSEVFLWVEAKPNLWWNESFGTTFNIVLNDEFGPMLVLVIISLLQAAILIVLFTRIRRLWQAFKRHQTSRSDIREGRKAQA